MLQLLAGLAQAVLLTAAATTPTANDIIARYVERVGGTDRIRAVSTLRRTGTLTSPSGREAVVVRESKRPGKVREEFSLQGMTGINAYDGATGWKVSPFQGKKDPETLGEEELKAIVEDADFDDPLIDAAAKGNQVESLGKDEFEGTDTYKLRVVLKDGDVRTYFMDADSYVPIKIETKRTIRGADQETETVLGDYKEVNGWLLPFSLETGAKNSEAKSKITYQRIEANVPIDDARFAPPTALAAHGSKP